MRVGLSPKRDHESDHQPARVTVCLLTFVPEQTGYYAHRFDVLKLCIASLLAHTPQGRYDLFVLDNGSCKEVVDYLVELRDRGAIQYLMLIDRNIGKLNAWQTMFAAAPGDLVAYSDDDVWFGPGWLEAHLDVLDTFPNVGMVSGRPVREQFRHDSRWLEEYLKTFEEISADRGHFIPDEWEAEWLRSTGRSLDGMSRIAARNTDVRLEYHGVQAYGTATHFQFMAPRSVMLKGLAGREWDRRLLGGEKGVEQAITAGGFVRLSTTGRHVRHIGNVVTEEFLAEHGSVVAVPDIRPWKAPGPTTTRLAQMRLVQAVLTRLHRWSYAVLNYRNPDTDGH